MKKLFTLLAVLATLTCVAAGPQFAKRANVTKATPVHGRHLTAQAAQKPAKVAIAPASKPSQKLANGKISRIRRAAAYEYTYNVCDYEGFETDTWFSITTSDEAYKFYFDILLPESALEVGKTYTLDDCDPYFTYLSNNTTYEMIMFTDLSLVLSKDTDGRFVVDAQCTAENGDTYHLTYAPLEYPETFTEVEVGDVDIRLLDYVEEQNVFQFMATNDVYDLGICVETDLGIEGHWTTADLLEGDYTYIYKNSKTIKLCDVTMDVTSLGGHNYHIDAKMYSFDGNVYLVKGDYIEPTQQNTADIVATNLKLDDEMFEIYKGFYGYGLADITASNDEYTITGSLLSYTTIAGHYDDYNHMVNELFITDADGNRTDCFASDLDIQEADDSWTIKGKVLCWDNTLYNLDLCFTIPDIKDEASYTSTDGELNDQTADLGAFQIYAMDVNWNEFSVALPADAVVSGHYDTLSEENKSYCYIYYDGMVYQMYSANFDLDTDGETFTLTGTCQGGDLLWDVNITGVFLSNSDPYDAAPEDGEIDVNFTLDEIVDYEISPMEGYAYIAVENTERCDSWACMLFIDGDELPAGEYPIDMSYAPGTAQPGLIYGDTLYPTMYFRFGEDGYVTLPVWYCTYGSINVDYDANGNIIIDCDALNSNYVHVHVTVNGQGSTGIQDVANDNAPTVGKYLENNRIVIVRNGHKYNTLGQPIK